MFRLIKKIIEYLWTNKAKSKKEKPIEINLNTDATNQLVSKCSDIKKCSETLNINELPNEILGLVFVFLPANNLLKQVNYTCKKWNKIIESDDFWTQKLLRDSKATLDLIKYLQNNNVYNPKCLYFKNPYSKNLILNPYGDSGFDHWNIRPNFLFQENSNIDINSNNISYDSYNLNHKNSKNNNNITNSLRSSVGSLDGFLIEIENNGSDPFLDENGNKMKKFATSNFMCSKYQIIDLEHEGVDRNFLNKAKPKIEIFDYYSARRDCEAEYYIRVSFYDYDLKYKSSISYREVFKAHSKDGKWREYKSVSRDYPDNLRYIIFHHGGHDAQNLVGFNGVKMTKSTVRFNLQ